VWVFVMACWWWILVLLELEVEFSFLRREILVDIEEI